MSRKEIADKYLNKWISRKLIVFIIASIGLFTTNITSGDWVIISAVYLGSQTATDIIERLIKAKGSMDGGIDYTFYNKKTDDTSGGTY